MKVTGTQKKKPPPEKATRKKKAKREKEKIFTKLKRQAKCTVKYIDVAEVFKNIKDP